MFRLPSSARTAHRRGLASAIALAVAFAGGAVVTTAVLPSPAYAQKYSRNFVKVYGPVADLVNAEDGDPAAAQAQLPAVYQAIENDDDRFAAGNVTLILGNKLSNAELQRTGLEMMLDSGKVPDEQVGQFQFIAGNLAYAAGDFAAARSRLQAGIEAGYTQDNPELMILQSYYEEDNVSGGNAYLRQLASANEAAGTQLSQDWILLGLQSAYDRDDLAGSVEVTDLLIEQYPTAENWYKGLQVLYSLGNYEGQELLDVLRLMRLTGAPMERREYVSYIETADPRIMGNEVVDVLAAAVASGELEATEEYYIDVNRVASERAPEDRRDAPGLAEEGRNSSTGAAAHNAGEVYLSMGAFAEAEEMYSLALEKGVEDANRTLTRLGMVQAQQGKLAEATETFGKVEGVRAPIATMWQAYVDTQS